MSNTIVFKGLALFAFSLFFVFDNIRIDLVMTKIDPDERFPFHRFYVAISYFLFLINMRVTINECLKNKALLVLLLYILVSMFWSSVPFGSFKSFFSQLTVMLVAIMVGLAYYEQRVVILRTLFLWFLLFVVASIAIAWFYPEVGVNTISFGKPRWIGVSDHPNELGATALVLIWLGMNYYYIGSSKKLVFLSVAMGYYVIIMADSLTSLVSSFAVMLYVIYSYKMANMNFIFKAFLFLLAFFIFVAIIGLYKSFPDLIGSWLEAGGRNATLSGRTKLWHKAIISLRGHWMFGYGFDNLKQVTERQYKQMYQMSHLHNGYLEVLLKGGVVGCLLLLIVVVKTMIYQFKIRKKHRSDYILLSSGLLMIFIHNFTQSSLLKGSITLSILFFYICILSSMIYHRDQYENMDLYPGI